MSEMNRVAKDVANRILIKYREDTALQSLVAESPEPFRTLIYRSGVVADPVRIDGSDYYHAIVDELEEQGQ